MNKKKEYYLKLIDEIDRNIWLEELKQIGRNQVREGIRLDFDKIGDRLKGIEEEIERVKERLKKDGKNKDILKELEELYDVQLKYNKDAEVMKEQMMGKYIESEKCYHGGLDEEINAYKKVIEGRQELKELVKRELKKI